MKIVLSGFFLLLAVEEHHHGNFTFDCSQLGWRYLCPVVHLDSGNTATEAGTCGAIYNGIPG